MTIAKRILAPFLARAWKYNARVSQPSWIHGIAVVAVILFAGFELGGRLPQTFLDALWLPLFFLSAGLLFRPGWRLPQQRKRPAAENSFPDLDEAWEEILHALDKHGIDSRRTPLFLILGGNVAAEDALFQGIRPILQFDRVSWRKEKSPLRIHANADRIYLTCPGCSALARQAGADRDPGCGPSDPARIEDAVAARLTRLCRLLRRCRPGRPVNGVLLLVPLTSAEAAASSPIDEVGGACREDLAVVRAALQVYCPVIALVYEPEESRGFREFTRRLPSQEFPQPVGVRFPLLPSDREAGRRIEEGLRWLCLDLFPPLINRCLGREVADQDEAEALRGNFDLYEFLICLREGHRRLSAILSEAAAEAYNLRNAPGGPVLFGGCFFSKTGQEKAFDAGALAQLWDSRNRVYWTQDARAEDAADWRIVYVGVLWLGLLVLGLATLGVFLWSR